MQTETEEIERTCYGIESHVTMRLPMINSHLQTGAATILIASLSLITILFLSRSCSGKSRDNFSQWNILYSSNHT